MGLMRVKTMRIILGVVLSTILVGASAQVADSLTPFEILEDLEFWLKLDDGTGTTTQDDSGGGNDGSNWTGAPQWVSGHIGPYALDFDNNEGIYTDAFSDTGFLGAITVCAWVNLDGVAYHQISGKHLGGGGRDAAFGDFRTTATNPARLYVVRSNAATNRQFSSGGNNFPLNTWTHVCMRVVDGNCDTVPDFCIDGTCNAATFVQGTCAGATTGSGAGVYVGRREDGNARMDGTIDDVRIYSRELTDAEISALAGDQ